MAAEVETPVAVSRKNLGRRDTETGEKKKRESETDGRTGGESEADVEEGVKARNMRYHLTN